MINKNFYPTPRNIIDKMYLKLDRDLISSILEPSAGKGDILDYLKGKYEHSYYNRGHKLYAVEIEPELKSILIDKGYSVIANDFLNLKTYIPIDTIIMNPPFDSGEKHLLKAIDTISRSGQIVCLLNEETIINPFSNERKRLIEKLNELGAETEYIGEAFKTAERKTNVRCAIVYIKIVRQVLDDGLFKGVRLKIAEELRQEDAETGGELVKYDELGQLIADYRTEVELYLTAVNATAAYNVFAKGRHKYVSEVQVGKTWTRDNLSTAEAVKEIRSRYWDKVLQSNTFEQYITSAKMKEVRESLDKQSETEFCLENILEIKGVLMGVFVAAIEEAAVQMFEEITKHHQAEYSKNIHYYSGWKTNKGSRINKKIILPSWTPKREFCLELGKVLNYFDGFLPYKQMDIDGYHPKAKTYECEYFDATIYLKGTMHITFKRLDLLDKFNLYVGRKKNWLPDEGVSKSERAKVMKDVYQHYAPDDDVDATITVGKLLLTSGLTER